MIKTNDKVFVLETKNNSYIFHTNELGLLLHDYFGRHIDLIDFNIDAIKQNITINKGSSVAYKDEKDHEFSMDHAYLEFSFPHKGDYRETQILFKNEEYGYVFDFNYDSYKINKDIKELKTLPSPHHADEELIIYLKDRNIDLTIELHYLVFIEEDVIARNIIVKNNTGKDLHILKALSMLMDINNHDYEILTLHGGWANEANKAIQEIKPGIYQVSSLTGSSSNRHNPFFLIKDKATTYENGEVIEVNLMYSGNHLELVQLDNYGILRLMSGINPFCFDYLLKDKEIFETPFAIMTYSNKGINDASQHMHSFVNNHVIEPKWNNFPRPIAINNWEATGAKFKQSQLLKLAKASSKYGIELFVLDDGWFSTRNDDKSGLGDYDVNKKKLPSGLDGLAKKINKLNMKFGLWFEPESVNPDSNLYKVHPEWAIKNNDRDPAKGRNQYILDLSNPLVQDYIIENVSKTLKSANIEYVKWDMNRHISDIIGGVSAGEFYHRYMLGLYHVMKELTKEFPDVLFEGCSSGGNRFDLGMLRYFPQTWTSDDTDSYERLMIQSGYALAYPPSSLSNHISASPHSQTLRITPLESRFNVASFGVLGFELIFSEMEKTEEKRVKHYIDIYKENRMTLQYGKFYQFGSLDFKDNIHSFVSKGEKDEVIIYYNKLQKMNAPDLNLNAIDLNNNSTYKVEVVPVDHNLKKFGSLVNAISPVHLNPNGALVRILSNLKTMDGEKEEYIVKGNLLNNRAILLQHEWAGTGINDGVRLMGDFGSRMYLIKEIEDGNKKD